MSKVKFTVDEINSMKDFIKWLLLNDYNISELFNDPNEDKFNEAIEDYIDCKYK